MFYRKRDNRVLRKEIQEEVQKPVEATVDGFSCCTWSQALVSHIRLIVAPARSV